MKKNGADGGYESVALALYISAKEEWVATMLGYECKNVVEEDCRCLVLSFTWQCLYMHQGIGSIYHSFLSQLVARELSEDGDVHRKRAMSSMASRQKTL